MSHDRSLCRKSKCEHEYTIVCMSDVHHQHHLATVLRTDLLGDMVENADNRYQQLRLIGLDEPGQKRHYPGLEHHHPIATTSGATVKRLRGRASRQNVLAPVSWCRRLNLHRQLAWPLCSCRTPLKQPIYCCIIIIIIIMNLLLTSFEGWGAGSSKFEKERQSVYLFQRLSVTEQRYNAVI